MSSFERMDAAPEEPEDESAENPETPKESESFESYDKTEWENLKQEGPAFAIEKGKEMGVPQEELDRFAEDIIARRMKEKDYGFVYRFRKNLGIGGDADIKNAGAAAYKSFFEEGNFGLAMDIAEKVYGKESGEWKLAEKADEEQRKKIKNGGRQKNEEEMENEEDDLVVTLSKDATFLDLFNAIDVLEEKEGLDEVRFEEELADNFNSEIAEEILSFRDAQADKAATTKIVDFFKEHGYQQADITAFLPIKFRRARKHK